MLQLVKAEEVACRAQEVQQERAFELDVHQVRRRSRGTALSLLGWEQQAVVVAFELVVEEGDMGLLTSSDPRAYSDCAHTPASSALTRASTSWAG